MKKLDLDENRLRELYAEDIQIADIATRFGCSRSCIERRAKKLGLSKARTGPKSGKRHPNWKGGIVARKGYRYLYAPDHPNSTKVGYVLEHRLVMERKLGRLLRRSEVVHHKDGNRQNNAPENLEVFQTNGEHLKHELSGRVPDWSEDGKRRIVEGTKKAAERRRIHRQLKSDGLQDIQTIDHQKA